MFKGIALLIHIAGLIANRMLSIQMFVSYVFLFVFLTDWYSTQEWTGFSFGEGAWLRLLRIKDPNQFLFYKFCEWWESVK